MKDSVILAETDLALLNALQLNPRAPWSKVADALRLSAPTVARRWTRLADRGVAWVTSHPGPVFGAGHCFAFVAITCTPALKHQIATTLAGDPHAVSVEVTAGSADLFVTVAVTDIEACARYVLERVDRIPGVTSSSALVSTRIYSDGGHWRLGALGAEERARLAGIAIPHHPPEQIPATLTNADRLLFRALANDGRATADQLAGIVATSAPTVRRRLRRLLDSGQVAMRCEVAASAVGLPVTITFWARIPPEQLDRAGELLARLPQVRLCTSVTGTTNLLVTVWLHTVGEIHRLEAEIAQRLPELRLMERSVTLYMVKRMGRLLDERGYAVGNVPMDLWSDPVPPPATEPT